METDTPLVEPSRHRIWRRRLLMAVLLIALLWWPGVRVWYFAKVVYFGTPSFPKDFTQLEKVLPPPGANLVAIYRGLPHQEYRAELWSALFTTSHRSIGTYRFYTTPITVPDLARVELGRLMPTAETYRPFTPSKQCGGYHPDYCLEWQSAGGTIHMLICTGCEEVILLGGGAELYCDLAWPRSKELRASFKLLEPTSQ